MAEYQAPEYHPAVEEYCETIFELQEDDVAVIQARIAERLDVSRPAVSEMVKKMEAEGLIESGRQITLTADGRRRLADETANWEAVSGVMEDILRGGE